MLEIEFIQSPGYMGSNWCWGKQANFVTPLPYVIPWLKVLIPGREVVHVGKSGVFILIAFLSGDSIASLLIYQAFHEAQNWTSACTPAT